MQNEVKNKLSYFMLNIKEIHNDFIFCVMTETHTDVTRYMSPHVRWRCPGQRQGITYYCTVMYSDSAIQYSPTITMVKMLFFQQVLWEQYING